MKSWGEKCWETERNKDILLFSEKQTIGKKTCLFGMELDPRGWAHGDKGVRKLEEIETSKSLKEGKAKLDILVSCICISVHLYIKKWHTSVVHVSGKVVYNSLLRIQHILNRERIEPLPMVIFTQMGDWQ